MARTATHPTRPAPVTSPDPRRYVVLARGMGIPAHDATRQVMDLIASREAGAVREQHANQ